jgi:excisionase family DNA binding protein
MRQTDSPPLPAGDRLQTQNDDAVMTVSEVAEYLHVHRITIYRLIEKGRLRPFRIGRVWRFERKALEALIASEPSKSSGD